LANNKNYKELSRKWDCYLDTYYKYFYLEFGKQNIQGIILNVEKLPEEKNNLIFQFFKMEVLLELRSRLNQHVEKINMTEVLFLYYNK